MTHGAESSTHFPRKFRLKRRHLVRSLFRGGDRGVVSAGPIRVLYRVVDASQLPQGVPVQVGVAAPRGFGGVRRNRIRRRLLEAYRQVGHNRLTESATRHLGPARALTLILMDRRSGSSGTMEFGQLEQQISDVIKSLESAIVNSAQSSTSN